LAALGKHGFFWQTGLSIKVFAAISLHLRDKNGKMGTEI
jgi:hypothetical protein